MNEHTEMAATEDEKTASCFWWRDRATEAFHVLILRGDLKRRKREKPQAFDQRRCYELDADTPAALVAQMQELGWDAPDADEVKRLCEAAPRWQLKTRRGRT